jgi:peptidoglycan/xylan/chitin deacetylase (PgdA/CDA1 family)
MAVLRARALAVAVGVPAAFAVLAATLTLASPGSPATAAESVDTATTTTAGVPAAGPALAMGVTRPFVRGSVVPVAVDHRVRTTDPVAFITIDDGVHKDPNGLRYVERNRLPVTAFVSAWTVKDRARYFQRLTQWGSVQNHSATHASLARSRTDLDHEICYTQRKLTRDFGTRPWLLRPPYGAGGTRLETQITARRCGIDAIVLWDAVVEKGRVTTTGSLRPGSVLLLHFTPNLERDIKAAVRAIREAGLRPADLGAYLPRS